MSFKNPLSSSPAASGSDTVVGPSVVRPSLPAQRVFTPELQIEEPGEQIFEIEMGYAIDNTS